MGLVVAGWFVREHANVEVETPEAILALWPSLIKPSCRLQKDRDGAIPAEFRLRAGGVHSDARDVVYGASRPGAADAVSRPGPASQLRCRSLGDDPELHAAGLVAATQADARPSGAAVAARASSAARTANAAAAVRSDGMSGLGRSVGGPVYLELHRHGARAVL